MTGRLDGKVAVITGGCSGIGLGTVELFVAQGARVVAADVQAEKGAMLEKRFPDAVRFAPCDVTHESQIAAAMELAQEAFGGLDILFNNAGHGGAPNGVADMTAEGWDATFALLLRGPVLGMKHALPLMLARGGGSVINTASIAGLQAGFGPLAYSTAKAAVIQLTKCAAAELSPQKIRVNAICPGLIATSIFGASMGLPREVADQMAARVAEVGPKIQPIPKAGLPDDIARAALYLASDDSEFVTGTHIVVDGGITIGGRSSWDHKAPSPLLAAMGITPEQAEQMRAAMVASQTQPG
ncbi:SDR family NAD(P)-dependent oxidoreductase [Caulobacter soli]|uniref:SDR family NAD(P)-dependent oxidoreductase n=1 Tax=Caulobacter soli TaxID=2708539 RepID=UPI0013EDFEE1|nr:glucose 1-dehydrogenase [Caulobacter soli]